jgi:hypothetical protein
MRGLACPDAALTSGDHPRRFALQVVTPTTALGNGAEQAASLAASKHPGWPQPQELKRSDLAAISHNQDVIMRDHL